MVSLGNALLNNCFWGRGRLTSHKKEVLKHADLTDVALKSALFVDFLQCLAHATTSSFHTDTEPKNLATAAEVLLLDIWLRFLVPIHCAHFSDLEDWREDTLILRTAVHPINIHYIEFAVLAVIHECDAPLHSPSLCSGRIYHYQGILTLLPGHRLKQLLVKWSRRTARPSCHVGWFLRIISKFSNVATVTFHPFFLRRKKGILFGLIECSTDVICFFWMSLLDVLAK